jgi:hypothetical protein
VGTQHQAGSDSLVTAEIFFKIKKDCFSNRISSSYHNVLYGIGTDSTLYCESPELSGPSSDGYSYAQPPIDEYSDYGNGSPSGVGPEYLPMPKVPSPMYYDRPMPGLYPRPAQYMMSQYYTQPYMSMNGNSHPGLNGYADHAPK